jgi:cytoskeletal protein CcmA (bactofilin family)
VDGEINAKDALLVLVGHSAVVSGQIKAACVVVAGKVDADITAARIEICPSGKVSGTLASGVLGYRGRGAVRRPNCDGARERKRKTSARSSLKESLNTRDEV